MQRDGSIPTLARPVLNPGRALAAIDGGVMITGPVRLPFHGTAAATVLDRVVRACDGTRDVDALAAETGLPVDHVRQVLVLLTARGALEEGDPDGRWLRVKPEARFLSPQMGATGFDVRTRDVLARVATARVLLAGSGGFADALALELERSGLRGLRTHQTLQAAAAPGMELVVAASEDADELAEVGMAARERGVPVLRVFAYGSTLEVGPYFDSEQGPCVRCFQRHQEAGPPGPPASDEALTLAAAMAAVEVVLVASKVKDVFAVARLRRLDLSAWTSETLVSPTWPDCHVCGAGDQPGAGLAGLAIAYEQLVQPMRPSLEAPRAGVKPPVQWPLRVKDLGDAARFGLPASSPEPDGSLCGDEVRGVSAAPLAFASLVGFLKRTFGLADGAMPGSSAPRRYAPTGGNMGSVQPYVIVAGVRDVPDLTPLFYDAYQHALLAGPGAPAGDNAIADVLGEPVPVPGAIVVLTAGVEVAREKYGSFSLKLAYMNAGCAITQARLVAAGYGLQAVIATSWDGDKLAGLLDVDPKEEPIMSVVVVRGAESP